MLYDEEARQALVKAQRRYVYESGCLQSGRASQIVADLVMQMARKPKKEAAGRTV
jgi:hypothetical protein